MALDAVTIQASFGRSSSGRDNLHETYGPVGEVWAAHTLLAEIDYVYLFVADLASDWTIYPHHLDSLTSTTQYWGFESNSTDDVFLFSNEFPLVLKVALMFTLW